jgi:copper transport protein
VRRLTVCVLLAALGLVLIGPRAAAHAQYRASNPANGERLEEAPEAVTITWTEPPEPSFTKISVLDSSGQAYETGAPEVLPDDRYTARVPVDDMPDGAYTVTWRTVSAADGHSSSGAFSFGLGVEAQGITARTGFGETIATPSASALEIIGRWGLLLGLVAVVGAGAVGGFVNPGSGAVARMAAAGALVAAAGGIAFAEAQRRAAETGFSQLLETDIGRSLLYRGIFIVICIAASAWAYRAAGRLRAWLLWAASIAAGAAMLAHVEAGHASAITSWTWAAVGAQWIHFIAAGIWIGGLGALLLAMRGLEGEVRGRAVKRFSVMAGIMLAAVVVTGVVRSITEIDSWSELFSSGYGRAVLIKVLLLCGLAGLGAINRYRNVPRSSTSVLGLRRISSLEIGVASIVIAVAAVLASISPPAEGAGDGAAPAPEQVVATGSDFGTSVRVRVHVAPGVPGANDFSVRVTDYDTGEPVDAERVVLRFSFVDDPSVGESELELEADGSGTYKGEGPNISLAGNWTVTTLVQRGADSVEVPLEVATRCDAREEAEPGVQPVWVMPLIHGISAESWVEPGTPGHNSVHLTFFDESGNESNITKSPTIQASTADGEESEFDVERFGPGHFVSTGHLVEGDWRIELSATIHGEKAQACYDETISSTD